MILFKPCCFWKITMIAAVSGLSLVHQQVIHSTMCEKAALSPKTHPVVQTYIVQKKAMPEGSLSGCTNDPDNVAVFQFMGVFHPHLCPRINRIQEPLPDISMDLEGKVTRS